MKIFYIFIVLFYTINSVVSISTQDYVDVKIKLTSYLEESVILKTAFSKRYNNVTYRRISAALAKSTAELFQEFDLVGSFTDGYYNALLSLDSTADNRDYARVLAEAVISIELKSNVEGILQSAGSVALTIIKTLSVLFKLSFELDEPLVQKIVSGK